MLGVSKNISGFNPRSIPGCQIWLDGADSNTVATSGGLLTQWNDKSGFGRNGVASGLTGCTMPTVGSMNGLPTVRFTATNKTTIKTVYSLPNGNETYFFAGQFTSSTQVGTRVMMDNSGGRQWLLNGTLPNTLYMYAGSTPSQTVTISAATPVVCSCVIGGGTLTCYTNSLQSSTASANSTTITTLYWGGDNAGGVNDFMDGDIGEAIVYSSTLTTAQRQQVEGYLAWKWGFKASLPTSHPSTSIPPLSRVFQPTDIPGCALWIDAADSSKITGTTTVTAVTDKAAGIALTTQGTSSFLSVSNAINGNQALYFNNTSANNVYLSGTLSNIPAGTMICIWQAATQLTATYRSIFTWNDSAGLNFPAFGYVNSLTSVGPYTTYVGGGTPLTTVTSGTNYISTYMWSGTTTNVGFNGANPTAGTQPAYSSSSTALWIGWDNVVATNFYLGELLLFTSNLTSSQRIQVEGYLAWKWGLNASLPSTHSFATFPASSVLLTSPLGIPGCALWLDGADSSTITLSGANVTQWNDKSGNARHMSNASSVATYSGGVLFNGTTNLSNATGFTNATAANAFVVWSSTVSSATRQRIYSQAFTASNPLLYIDNIYIDLHATASVGNYQGPIAYTTGATYLYSATTESSTTITWSSNATASSTWTATETGTTTTQLLVGGASGVMFTGTVMEVVHYDGYISPAQRQQVEGYLAWKWGLRASFPSSHPFIKFNPAF